MEKHNGIISLWKFLFAIVITFFHCNIFYINSRNPFFYGGYIAVEFFFIVSGYYFCKSILNSNNYQKEKIGRETASFIINKLKKFYPYMIFAFITYFLIALHFYNYKLSDIANSIWNFLLLKEAGFKTVDICVQFWYITAMLVTMFIMYPILKKYRENFIYLISPLIVFFCLGYLNHNWTGLDHSYGTWTGLIYTGIIRAIAEINIGFIIYMINQRMKNVKYTKLGKIILTLVGEVSLLLVLFIINYLKTPKNYDYIMLLLISIAIAIFVSEKTYDYDILSVNFFYYLEKISLPIFINHTAIIASVNKLHIFYDFLPKNKSIIAVILTIIISMIEMEIFNYVRKKGLIKKARKLVILN